MLRCRAQELNKVDPWATVRRFESNQFVANDQCVREYVAALGRLQRLDRLVPFVSQGLAHGSGSGGAAGLHPAGNATAAGTGVLESAFASEAAGAGAQSASSAFGGAYSSMQGATSYAPPGMRMGKERRAPLGGRSRLTRFCGRHTGLRAAGNLGAAQQSVPAAALGAAAHSGTNSDPIHVVMQEPGTPKQQRDAPFEPLSSHPSGPPPAVPDGTL